MKGSMVREFLRSKMKLNFFVFSFILLATQSYAQNLVQDGWCGEYDYDRSNVLSWDALAPTVRAYTSVGEIEDAYRHVYQTFLEVVYGVEGINDIMADDRLIVVSSAFSQQLDRVRRKEPENPEYWNADDSTDVVVYEYGNDLGLEIDCVSFSPNSNNAKSEIDRAIGYFSYAMKNTGQTDIDLGRKLGAVQATVTYQSYEDLLYKGLAMWPWELWVNGFLVPKDFSQPASKNQIVLMRPNVSPALKFDGNENSRLDYSLTLEPFGYVRYLKDDYSRWWGISPMVSITSEEGIGYGANFRWDNFTVGWAYHSKDSDNMLYVSIDLYKYILGEKGRTNQASTFLKKVGEKYKR